MVSANGGTPIPITKETAGVLGVKCSSDGQKLLYQQLRFSGDFWIVNIAKNRPQQITFRNEYQGPPAFSPDGKEIAFGVGGYGESTPSHLFIMNRDGTNRRQLSFGDDIISPPIWSPDGKRIAYGARRLLEPIDSFRTYVIEPSNPGSSKYITRGIPNGGWLDSVRFQVQVNNTIYVTSIYGAPLKAVYDDSTRAFFIQGGKYIVFHDFHQGKDKGVWIVDGTKPRDVQRKTARLLSWNSHNITLSGDEKTIYSIRGVGELWRMTLPDGKEERIRGNFLGVETFFDFSPSWDGKEMIIFKRNRSSSIVMIENLFK